MGRLIGMFTVPFTTAFALGLGIWNKTGDWGWHVVSRILATVIVLGGTLFFFVWAFVGFQWPLWGNNEGQ